MLRRDKDYKAIRLARPQAKPKGWRVSPGCGKTISNITECVRVHSIIK